MKSVFLTQFTTLLLKKNGIKKIERVKDCYFWKK